VIVIDTYEEYGRVIWTTAMLNSSWRQEVTIDGLQQLIKGGIVLSVMP